MLNWLSSRQMPGRGRVEPAADRVLGKGTEWQVGAGSGGCICPLSPEACDLPGRGAPAWKDVGKGKLP